MAKKQQKAGTLYIRDVPQTTLERLKRASKLNGRSSSKQARQVLIETYEPLPPIPDNGTRTANSAQGITLPEPQTVTA